MPQGDRTTSLLAACLIMNNQLWWNFSFLLFITLFAFDFFGHETSKRQISSSIRCCKRHRPGSYNINDEHNSLFFYLELLSMLFVNFPRALILQKVTEKQSQYSYLVRIYKLWNANCISSFLRNVSPHSTCNCLFGI